MQTSEKHELDYDDLRAQKLSLELQKTVQALCETYEAIDLRIETSFGMAEEDFRCAMPAVDGYEAELDQLVALLIADVKQTVAAKAEQPLLLRFAYQNKNDLVAQLLTGTKARLVVVPVEDAVSLHANIPGL